MKKLLLLSVFCFFAQLRTEESKFPEMTDKMNNVFFDAYKIIRVLMGLESFKERDLKNKIYHALSSDIGKYSIDSCLEE